MEVTRKMLEDYRKIKAEIPLLEYELKEMRLTDTGFWEYGDPEWKERFQEAGNRGGI